MKLTSRKNPLFLRIGKLLRDAGFRREEGLFVIEGRKLVAEASAAGVRFETVVAAEEADLAPYPEARCVLAPPQVFQALSEQKTPQGIMAVCALPEGRLPDRFDPGRYLVLDGVQDPGNVGTILRSAAAFGCGGVLLLPGCADPFSPKAVRASMGAVFHIPLYFCGAEAGCAALTRSHIPLWAADLCAGARDVRAGFPPSVACVIGSEGRGVSPGLRAAAEAAVTIPIGPGAESLNAAVAASVLLWEMARGDV